VGNCGRDASESGKGPVAGHCEQSNKPFGSVTGGEFCD
jgi:hypothetical protein